MSPLFPPIRNPQSAIRNGFTLVELLVVLSLIVLALAAAVPAFNYITGSRSTDSAQNIIGAMLQRARSQAIQSHVPTGVAFFINPRDQRATLALVVKSSGNTGVAEDPYSNYRGWTDSSYQQNSSGSGAIFAGPPYASGQEVVALYHNDFGTTDTKDTNQEYRHIGRPFLYDPTPANSVNSTGNSNNISPPSKQPWDAADGSTGTVEITPLDFLSDSDFETLPAGIGAQTINDPKGQLRDRYLQIGVILFDPNGRLVSIPYAFQGGTSPSQAFQLLATKTAPPAFLPVSTTAANTLYSQLGVVLYDRAAFLNQPGATEGDYVLQSAWLPNPPTTYAAGSPEYLEEQWLDQNTTPLFVNRGNGTLLKGQ